MIYITGDTHRNFTRIKSFFDYKINQDNICIILGDAGINYYGEKEDKAFKKSLSYINATLFCVHGNHENRPQNIKSYITKSFHGGLVMYEKEYPNILFPVDGEIFDFNGNRTIIIGGAYSVDKWYRLSCGYNWFSDEQPNDEIKKIVESRLELVKWKVDVILSHTCPSRFVPTDKFLKGINQESVDKTTEQWLQTIENKLNYNMWYAGHYHLNRKIDNFQFLYEDIIEFI